MRPKGAVKYLSLDQPIAMKDQPEFVTNGFSSLAHSLSAHHPLNEIG